MGIISGIKSLFDISTWMGTKRIKDQTNSLKELAKTLITPAKPKRHESFDEAVKRLHLKEEDIIKRSIELKRLIIVFSVIVFLLLLYFVYLIYKQAWIASMGCFGILLVMLGQVFRYHFWLYQIREKKLGKSFRDWLKSLGG